MSFKVGDRVKVTFETVIQDERDDDGEFFVDIDGQVGGAHVNPDKVTMEKIVVPFEVGDIVRDRGGEQYAITTDGYVHVATGEHVGRGGMSIALVFPTRNYELVTKNFGVPA